MAHFSRRSVLLAWSGLLLAACGPSAPVAAPTAAPAKPTEAPKPAAPASPAAPAAPASPAAAASPATASASPAASPATAASPTAAPAASPAAKPAASTGAWPPARGSVVGQAPAGKSFSVGIIQFVSHPALDAARMGTIKALDDNGYKDGQNLKIDYQNGQADVGTVNTIAQRFRDANLDLVVAIATPPYQAMMNVIKDTGKPPLVFNSIVDPFAAAKDVVKSPTDKPPFVTGLQALPPVEDAMQIARKCVPNAKKFGIVWNPTEANSVVVTGVAREAAGKLGIELIEQTISKPDEVLQGAQALVQKGIDLFFVSTDSTVVTAFEALVKVAIDNKKPVFANDPSSAARGAAAALGIDYEQVGYESGQMAAMYLSGKPMSEIKIEKASLGLLAINTKAANDQGVMLPADVMAQAKQTYNEIAAPKP
ncbi:MAG: ABC transporter substrate-binding protein [Chloroflexi bacterium]|nr:ABC transporter substrate-binding protein [Chloroflexota bacterium]